ncbi:putative RNA-directed DNA polymerase from transposon BS [Labeo rohita]|uniref:RNA-directed DNA polymerase from transposon BS n=1 Tax=Labeo rohita TaxID=84645 RepID=A0ABQ8MV64_LABRO|nr:putative RNA-directed DNA polymerase from transposon BS [Labeo rohita]
MRFIRKCVEDVVPTKTIRIYPNQKPWINSNVRAALSAWTSAFKSGNPDDCKQASYNLTLHTALSHLENKNIYENAVCRTQVVRLGNNTSSPLTLNTGAPQGCILSLLLYSLYKHDCAATHSSNIIIKFADDTTVKGLITDSDEMAYREELSTLTKWCQENHLSLNIDKTKELVVGFRRQSREHIPITINTCGVG